MIITVDVTSDIPIYQQIRDRVVEAIADGTLAEGSRLPSTRQLAADFGVNFHTVNKAYDLLRREGFLLLAPKRGATVRRDPSSGAPEPAVAADWESRARTLLAEAVAHGMPEAMVLDRCRAILAARGGSTRAIGAAS